MISNGQGWDGILLLTVCILTSTYGHNKRKDDVKPFSQRDSPMLLFCRLAPSGNHQSDSGRSIENSPVFYIMQFVHYPLLYLLFFSII